MNNFKPKPGLEAGEKNTLLLFIIRFITTMLFIGGLRQHGRSNGNRDGVPQKNVL